MSFYGNRRKPSKADLAHQREMSAPPCGKPVLRHQSDGVVYCNLRRGHVGPCDHE
jgi:hypothetical protein